MEVRLAHPNGTKRYPPWLQKAMRKKEQTEQFWLKQQSAQCSVHKQPTVEMKAQLGKYASIWDAVLADDAASVQLFLEKDHKMLHTRRKKGPEGSTAVTLLHEAAFHGALAVMKYLNEYMTTRLPQEVSYALANAVDTCYSQTTSLIAVCRGSEGIMHHRIEIVRLLLQMGADVAHQDAHGDNALHWCARASHAMLLRCLLKESDAGAGAIQAENYKRETPLDIAKRQLARKSCLSTATTYHLLQQVDRKRSMRLKMQVIKRNQLAVLAEERRTEQNKLQLALETADILIGKAVSIWKDALLQAEQRRQAAEDEYVSAAAESAKHIALEWLETKDGKNFIKKQLPTATTIIKTEIQNGTLAKPKDLQKFATQRVQDTYVLEKEQDAKASAVGTFRANRQPYPHGNVSVTQLKDFLERPTKSKLREPSDAKTILASRIAAPKDEKRTATHTTNPATMDDKATRSGSSNAILKESKLKQPEVRPKIFDRTRISSSLPSTTATATTVTSVKALPQSSDHLTKKPTGVDKHQDEPTDQHHHKAEGKESDTSLHKVRSVQSLANEIRRIRSLRTDNEGNEPVEEKQKKPEKKPSGRSKIKLEISESFYPDEHIADEHPAPGRQPTYSPTSIMQQKPIATTSPTISSTGKKGISRNFVQGLGTNFQLDLQQSMEQSVNKSYDLSASGTFDAVGFQIKQSGLTRSPDRILPGQQQQQQHVPSMNTKKYLVKLGVLGRGASGVVHKALHVPSLLLVAVKVIPVFENEKRHQLIAELKALYNNLSTLSDDAGERKTVACPDIVCLYDAFMNPNEGNVSIVVEYMDGGSLQDIVDTGGCKSESVLANISYRVLKGLKYLHGTHQLHRDIKPGNLLINHFGDVKISDFGIVREMENSLAKATTFVGTLTYMSPERIASEEYSYKSDVWSFGLSIMTCALGRFPYSSRGGYWELLHMIRNEPPPHLPEGEFSDVFRDFLDKCLKKDQSERWSVKELLKHDFVKNCEAQANATASTTSVDEDDDGRAKATDNEEEQEDSKEQMEVDEIVQKVTNYYMKDAKELITDHGYTLTDIVSWIQLLPAMQKVKLARLADQIGARRRLVYTKFQTGMNELLQDIQEQYFDDKKQNK